MNHYKRVEAVIRHLDRHFTSQPDLSSLAKQAGLSRFQFHRLFSAWAGVTPKDFLQCLTFTYVKRQLREGKSVLDAAFDSGLSGPGRLHDLCVRLEAASPGEIKSGGEGWRIRVGFAESPFGTCLIAEGPRGICHLSFTEAKKNSRSLEAIQKDWPRAKLFRDDAHAVKLARRIFNRSPRKVFPAAPLCVWVKGSAFQVAVWKALLQIPRGTLVSYGHLAKVVKKSGAARAAGSAVAKNPVAYLIPCHRVIRETGAIGEYHWGGIRKKAILAWESASRS